MDTAERSEPTIAARRPFRALEEKITRWNPRAEVEVDGDDLDHRLIGGESRGPSPRATVTLIGTGGSLIRGGNLIGASGARAPRDPDPPSGSGGAPVDPGPRVSDVTPDVAGAGVEDGPSFDDELLARLGADRERLTDIARALGACPACWGERIGCHRCGGVGRPGSTDPRAPEFDRYIRPLLDRLDRGATSPRRSRPRGSDAHPAGRGSAFGIRPT